ncbi:MAG TPA: hypothetical protein VFV99_32320 [Kofleriaceae bacterium]|nr:hypothetical protein [Kofleriaceae bacterium]
MPQLKFTGDRLPIGSVGSRQVVANPTSKAADPPIQYDRFARNGKHPNVALIQQMQGAVNAAVMYRSKQVFSIAGRLNTAAPVVSAADRPRWRFAFHTSPYTHALMAVVSMLPPDVDISPPGYANTSGRLDIANGAGSIVATQSFYYGLHPVPRFSGLGGYVPDWKHIRWFVKYVDGVAADTDYFGTFYDVNYGRLQSACVFELPSMTEFTNGYLAENISGQSPILDVYREKQATIMRNLWRRAGAHLINWTVDDQGAPLQRTANTTQVNVIDLSTTFNASDPAFTLVMDGKNRRTQSAGIPCVMKAYGVMSAGTNGSVYLKNGVGTIVAQIVSAWGTTPSWQTSAVFNLPATTDRYFLHVAGPASGTFSLGAISVYPYTT